MCVIASEAGLACCAVRCVVCLPPSRFPLSSSPFPPSPLLPLSFPFPFSLLSLLRLWVLDPSSLARQEDLKEERKEGSGQREWERDDG